MTPARESRPAGNQAAEVFSGRTDTSISAATHRTGAAALVTGVHVVVVETTGGKHRRRVYLTLNSAQLAADRAVMAGHSAHIVLAQLMPVAGGEA